MVATKVDLWVRQTVPISAASTDPAMAGRSVAPTAVEMDPIPAAKKVLV